ncbi:unnamed protein product, partial [Pylaiella littoralis]
TASRATSTPPISCAALRSVRIAEREQYQRAADRRREERDHSAAERRRTSSVARRTRRNTMSADEVRAALEGRNRTDRERRAAATADRRYVRLR